MSGKYYTQKLPQSK